MNHSLTITPHGLMMRDTLPAGPDALVYLLAQAGGDITSTQLREDLQVWSLDDPTDLFNEDATRMAECFMPLYGDLYGPCTFTAAHDTQGNIRGVQPSVTRELIGLYDALRDTDHVASLHHRTPTTPEQETGRPLGAQLTAAYTP